MANTNSLRGVATINIYAADVKAARKWYSELLGIDAYFNMPDAENPGYTEFRLGDYQHELGIIDSKYAPKSASKETGGAIVHWHVDNIEAMFERLKSMGAKEYEPITPRGNSGFVTASVIDPFGNVLGIMSNPHYLEILNGSKKA